MALTLDSKLIRWTSGLALSAFILLQSQQQSIADSPNPFKSGIEAYEKKDYKGAIRHFSAANKIDPYNAELHYFLANSYVFQNNGEAAIKEYSRCFDLEPLSIYGQYSRQALLSFGKNFKGFVGKDDGKEHLAPDDPRSIRQAVALIRQQTMEQDKRSHSSGEKAADSAIQNGEARARQINKDAEQLSEDLAPHARTQAAQEELHEIKQKAVFASQHARYEAQQQAAKHMERAAQNAISLESSAASLLRLMSEDPKPGKVKLMALGTNLYVRNYGMEPKPPLEPLLAEWELIGSNRPKAPPGVRAQSAPSIKIPNSKRIDLDKQANYQGQMAPPMMPNNAPRKNLLEQPAPQNCEESFEPEFVPGSSKVLVTDMRGRVLLHIKEKSNRQERQ